MTNAYYGSNSSAGIEVKSALNTTVGTSSPKDVKLALQTAVATRKQSVSLKPWLYLDPRNNVQGPFQTSEMRNWLEAGYFQIDLPVKLDHWTNFHPLGTVFPSPDAAFFPNLPEEPVKLASTIMSAAPPGDLPSPAAVQEEAQRLLGNSVPGKLHPQTDRNSSESLLPSSVSHDV
jgi:PERQ amino acid-rich with GYF domain-containing protein